MAGTASTPRLAVILPNSSNEAEFISSCIAFGCSGIDSLLPFSVSNVNGSPPCWLILANPSHLVVVFGSVQFPLLRTLMGGYDNARVVHFLAMSVLVTFFVVHVVMVALVPRSLLLMVRGR